MNQRETMSDQPVFVLGCSKSGTSLLRNLFDGHPAVFAAPLESHFFQHTGSWVSYFFRRSNPRRLTIEQMKNELVSWIDFSNRRVNLFADGFTAGKWDLEKFKETMFSKQVSGLRELSDLYIESMYVSLYDKPYPGLIFVEKSVENVEFVQEWLKLYPNAKFVHILRNPYSNLVAIRKFMHSVRVPFLNRALVSMQQSYYFLYKNLTLINPAQYKVILYEDLLNDPNKIMTELANFAGIDFEDILLTPTISRETWSGNSTNRTNFTGVSNQNIEKWKDEITRYEIFVVNKLFDHVLTDFKFEKISPDHVKKSLLPKEGLFNYAMNKISYYYLPKPNDRMTDEQRKKSKERFFVQDGMNGSDKKL
ncbi:MAG TPA: sulfotransferase [Parafilimonas sp.]|nr:sulfotransferase [Parafilimonas sp.]